MHNANSSTQGPSTGYVVKRYPRYSETFIVNEIIAHERAGMEIEIFSVRPPVDTHFQCLISQVRAPVRYLPGHSHKTSSFWESICQSCARHPSIAARLPRIMNHDASEVAAAVALADRAIEADLTHLHAHFATSASEVAYLAHQLTGIPYTITAHAKDIFHESVDEVRLAELIAHSEATITVSDFNVRFLRDRIGNAAEKVVRIYNGLDLSQFAWQSPKDRAPIVIGVGRLIEKKGFEYLIAAASILKREKIPLKVILVGDGSMAEQLHQQAASLRLGDTIEFLGPQPQRVVKELIQRAAVFAAPCVDGNDGNRDGLPTVLLEAMALGTPCISTPVTGIPEVVLANETGMMVPCHDEKALATAIAMLLADSQRRVDLSVAARQKIEQDFDVHSNTRQQRLLFRDGMVGTSRNQRTSALPIHQARDFGMVAG